MNGDRGEGFEGDFAACRRINVSLRIATSVSQTASHKLLGFWASSEDEGSSYSRTKRSRPTRANE